MTAEFYNMPSGPKDGLEINGDALINYSHYRKVTGTLWTRISDYGITSTYKQVVDLNKFLAELANRPHSFA